MNPVLPVLFGGGPYIVCFIQQLPEKSTGSTASQQKGSNHAGQEPCTFACTSCTSCILFKAASKDSDAAIHKKRRHKQRAASLLASESLIQSKRADELISVSLRNVIKKSTGNSLPPCYSFSEALHITHACQRYTAGTSPLYTGKTPLLQKRVPFLFTRFLFIERRI